MDEQRSDQTAPALVIGVTGHRKLHGDEVPALESQVRGFFLDLQARYPQLPLLLLSPLAEGADSLVAEVALELGIPVVAPLPLPLELYRGDFGSEESLARFESQAAQARILQLPLDDHGDEGSAALPGPARDRHYAEAGIFVSRHCHILLALWDGGAPCSEGGTAHVVRFHLHGELPAHLRQRRASLGQLGIVENALVRHLPASRAGAPTSVSTTPRWLTAQDDPVTGDQLPTDFDRMFCCQSEFNADAAKYAKPIAEEVAAVRTQGNADCPVHRLFVAADWLASTYQRRVARVLRATYVIAGATGAAFILYAHVKSQDAMIYFYLVLFAAGVGLATLAKRRAWHRKYLDYRALAEGLRVQSYWRRAEVVSLRQPASANDNFMQEQDLELGWIRNVLRAASLEGLLVPVRGDDETLDEVIEEWIGTPTSDGQLRYFTDTGARRERQHHRAEMWASSSLAVGIGISVLLALFAHRWGYDIKNTLVIVMGLLSVGAGVHEAYAHKKADKELVKQYRFMQRIYAGARRRLDVTPAAADRRGILRVLGEAALAEHAEWTLMHRERPLEHTRLGG